jgi:carbamoyltransferase
LDALSAGYAAGPSAQVLDSKPYIEHDPQLGYRYLPNLKLLLPRPGGGRYSFETNSQGIRSVREYSFEKPPGIHRIIVCGDSMPAGQYVSNEHRFTELLERFMPNTEVINLALEGSGTDQQLLVYENVGRKYEHDLVLLMPFLSNIRRNMLDARTGYEAKTKTKVLRGKPRFDLVEGQLVLRNVPVPIENSIAHRESTVFERTDAEQSWLVNLKSKINSISGVSTLKRFAYAFIPWEPFPEYRTAHSPEWQLMEAIIKRFKESAGKRPLVIVPTFYDSYIRYRMARNYWQRFNSLSSIPGINVIDLLPYFRKLGADGARCFQVPYDMHFSAYGHLVVAEALQEELSKRSLLSGVEM